MKEELKEKIKKAQKEKAIPVKDFAEHFGLEKKEVKVKNIGIKVMGHKKYLYIQLNELPLKKTFGIVHKTKTVHETKSQIVNLDFDRKGKLFGIEIMW